MIARYSRWVNAKIDASMIEDIVILPEVCWVEKYSQPKPLWGLQNIRNYMGVTYAETTYGYDGTGVRVAVADTGFRYSHQEFGSNPNSTTGTNDQILKYYTYGGPMSDLADHGTPVASIIAGLGVGGTDFKGIAPGARLVVQNMMFTSQTQRVNGALSWGVYD